MCVCDVVVHEGITVSPSITDTQAKVDAINADGSFLNGYTLSPVFKLNCATTKAMGVHRALTLTLTW